MTTISYLLSLFLCLMAISPDFLHADNQHNFPPKYYEVRDKMGKLIRCVLKKANANAEIHSMYGEKIREIFGGKCAHNPAEKKSLMVRYQNFGNFNVTDFAERLYAAGMECLSQADNVTECCAKYGVAKSCYQLCGGGKDPLGMELQDTVFCRKYGSEIINCQTNAIRDDKATRKSFFKEEDPNEQIKGFCNSNAVFGFVAPIMDAVSKAPATGGISLVMATAGFLTNMVVQIKQIVDNPDPFFVHLYNSIGGPSGFDIIYFFTGWSPWSWF